MKIRENSKSRLLSLVYIAMFVAILVICSQIQIPFGQIPFTLQTLGIFLAAAMLGLKRGTVCVLIYILMGIIGLPVFSGFKGGVGVIAGPTGGYIVGFLFTAVIVGGAKHFFGNKLWVNILSMLTGFVVYSLFGTIWFMIFAQVGFFEALMLCVVPFLVPDLLKIAIASILINRLDKHISF